MEGAWVGPLYWIQWAGGAAASFPAGGGVVREAVARLPDRRVPGSYRHTSGEVERSVPRVRPRPPFAPQFGLNSP